MESAAGLIKITADEEGITSLWFVDTLPTPEKTPNRHTEQCEKELAEYFAGQRETFAVALHPQGTPFQKRVWNALLEIPYGQTASYLDLAKILGDEKLTRAVGTANGQNPIGIIIPCHRIIGSDGSLTGYAGGLHRKKWLLQLEGVIKQTELF